MAFITFLFHFCSHFLHITFISLDIPIELFLTHCRIKSLPLCCQSFGPITADTFFLILFQITNKFRFFQRRVIRGGAHHTNGSHRRFNEYSLGSHSHNNLIDRRNLPLEHKAQTGLFKLVLFPRPLWSSFLFSAGSRTRARWKCYPRSLELLWFCHLLLYYLILLLSPVR